MARVSLWRGLFKRRRQRLHLPLGGSCVAPERLPALSTSSPLQEPWAARSCFDVASSSVLSSLSPASSSSFDEAGAEDGGASLSPDGGDPLVPGAEDGGPALSTGDGRVEGEESAGAGSPPGCAALKSRNASRMGCRFEASQVSLLSMKPRCWSLWKIPGQRVDRIEVADLHGVGRSGRGEHDGRRLERHGGRKGQSPRRIRRQPRELFELLHRIRLRREARVGKA